VAAAVPAVPSLVHLSTTRRTSKRPTPDDGARSNRKRYPEPPAVVLEEKAFRPQPREFPPIARKWQLSIGRQMSLHAECT